MVLATVSAYAEDSQPEVKLVYPSSAAFAGSLDSSTPAKRATPPVKEETEIDPVTPIGQIRNVVNSLEAIEGKQADLMKAIRENNRAVDLSSVANKKDVQSIFDELANAASERASIAEGVQAAVNVGTAIEEKVDALSKSEPPKRSRFIDGCVVLIVFLVLIQLLSKGVSAVVETYRERAKEREEAIAARAYARAEAEFKRNNQN